MDLELKYNQNNKAFQAFYDNGYNRTSSTNTISNQTLNFTYRATTNRLTSYKLNNVVTNMTYDNNGNTLTEGSAVYSYDLRNNLISFSKGSDNATYTFNALGQRISKTSSGVTTYFVYDDATNLVGEYDSNGNALSEHIYLNNVPVGLVKDNSLYYVHTDHIGTPRAITNNANNIVWQWHNLDAFGSNLPNVEAIAYNKRFPGQYFDNESKLHYNYYRTYNPLIGRYIQSDPLGLAAGFNTYSYVESNPLALVDPLGLDCVAIGKRVKCNVPNGPIISFPRPEGWPDTIKKGDNNYHYYNKWTNAKKTDDKCLTNYIINNPTPGKSNAATYAGIGNNANPDWMPEWVSNTLPNPVITYLASYGNSSLIINVTQKNHKLFPGYVVRQITKSAEGNIINNFGEGTGWMQNKEKNPLADTLINNEWYSLNKNAINNCTCKNK